MTENVNIYIYNHKIGVNEIASEIRARSELIESILLEE
jgi:hypothetical protein